MIKLRPSRNPDNIVVWFRSEVGTNTTTDGGYVTVWNNSASNSVYNLQNISSIATINSLQQINQLSFDIIKPTTNGWTSVNMAVMDLINSDWGLCCQYGIKN